MERALNGTKMGGFKLSANLARFAKENVGIFGKKNGINDQDGMVSHRPRQESKTHSNAFINQGKGKLFSDLFNKETSAPKYGQKGQGSSVPGDEAVWERNCCIELSDETAAFIDLVGLALIGRCKDLWTLRNLNTLLSKSSVKGVSLSYLGGLSMLLKFQDEDGCNNFLLDHNAWKDWFKCLDVWNCQSLPFERLAWVRILGVPIHLAENDVLNNIAEHFGKIVYGSQLEANDRDLSVSWIGLLVGDGNRIHDQVTLKWKDKQYRVWVEEEMSNWFPDSVGSIPSLVDVTLSPNKQDSGNAQIVNSLQGDVSENQESGPVHEKSGEAIKVNHGESNSRLEPNINCMENVSADPQPINSEPSFYSCGTQVLNKQVNIPRGDILFFNSSAPHGRPKKSMLFRRPRSNTHRNGRMSSPISEERPRKRPRDDGVFKFDLNVDPREKNDISVQDKGRNENVVTRQDTDSEPNKEQVSDDKGLNHNGEYSEVDGASPKDVEVEEVADTFDAQESDELEATLRTGNIIGVNLSNHIELVNEAIRCAGKYNVCQ
ncbi:hypothetical protein HanPI659440_Chr02g0080501 [Helianthus annuus]|nr:hypothetical protein HanPI659440_Chr02g0080501 [Helianthus annuus]